MVLAKCSFAPDVTLRNIKKTMKLPTHPKTISKSLTVNLLQSCVFRWPINSSMNQRKKARACRETWHRTVRARSYRPRPWPVSACTSPWCQQCSPILLPAGSDESTDGEGRAAICEHGRPPLYRLTDTRLEPGSLALPARRFSAICRLGRR